MAKRVTRRAAKQPVRRVAAKKHAARKPQTRSPRPAKPGLARDLALEAAILDAPLDPLPRLVYGDWLQSVGARRGEWVTLSAGVEADPKNARLRAAAVAFLDDHRGELLGAGAALLPGAWIGWRCGFIDELRLQPFHAQRTVVRAVEALLAHPSCRFVRHIAIGRLPRAQELMDALARAAPPLLESLLVFDDHTSYAFTTFDVDALAFDSLRRLAIKNVRWTTPMPRLVELILSLTNDNEPWLLDGVPALEELTLDCRSRQPSPQYLTELLARLSNLRILRILHAPQADELAAAIAPHAGRLSVIDLSHSRLSDAGATRFLGARHVQLLALRTNVTPATASQLREQLRDVAVSNPAGPAIHDLTDDHTGTSWLSHRLVTEGRDALRLVPAAGRTLYSLGTNHSISDREAQASPLLDASVSMPSADYDTWAWANAAIAHARLHEYDEAELLAREGLLRAPREPNFFAIILHALRCVGRGKEGLRMIARARTALANTRGSRHTSGAALACLGSCLFTFAQAGRHTELLEFAAEHEEMLDPNMHALIAMSHVALGNLKSARAAFRRAGTEAKVTGLAAEPRRRATYYHATAVMSLASKPPAKSAAIAELARAKAAAYYDWHWIATDPNLAALHGEPEFAALLGPR